MPRISADYCRSEGLETGIWSQSSWQVESARQNSIDAPPILEA
jgi:hypothetical protein